MESAAGRERRKGHAGSSGGLTARQVFPDEKCVRWRRMSSVWWGMSGYVREDVCAGEECPAGLGMRGGAGNGRGAVWSKWRGGV